MENLKEVDWSKAPEGATHYSTESIYPWLKETPASYFAEGGEAWVKYRSEDRSIYEGHFFNAVKRPQEWDGSGLPPIGAVCEYLWAEGEEWRKCEVVAYYFANVVAIDVLHSSSVLLCSGLFRPIKTPEQIAKEERRAAIKEMFEVARGRRGFQDILEILYDAGYRRSEVKK